MIIQVFNDSVPNVPTFLIHKFICIQRNNYITLYTCLHQTEIPYDKKKIIKLQKNTHISIHFCRLKINVLRPFIRIQNSDKVDNNQTSNLKCILFHSISICTTIFRFCVPVIFFLPQQTRVDYSLIITCVN